MQVVEFFAAFSLPSLALFGDINPKTPSPRSKIKLKFQIHKANETKGIGYETEKSNRPCAGLFLPPYMSSWLFDMI